ncbi:hypothetical protein B0H14DRAFT_3095449 [Mycena olivaceomarginata]|nr:hypothetical protein B0H14DRAFT_3095449 [Mycena olivaceomarginata]
MLPIYFLVLVLSSGHSSKVTKLKTSSPPPMPTSPSSVTSPPSGSPFVTTVTYCATRTANLCSGPCTVYTGGATCLDAPGTACLSATSNVAFCDKSGCKGTPCNVLSSCGTKLDDGFCFTPGTKSISVPS